MEQRDGNSGYTRALRRWRAGRTTETQPYSHTRKRLYPPLPSRVGLSFPSGRQTRVLSGEEDTILAIVELILAIHATSTLTMVGVIWFVQLVHYPLMQCVGADHFSEYELEHQRRTTWVVAPLMLTEAATTAYLVLAPSTAYNLTVPWIAAALLALVWASTFLVQVPCHERLANGYNRRIAQTLVRTNCVRTVAWSLRGGLAIIMAIPVLP